MRNPVPSKLKGVTEEMRGNFGVMHMDVSAHRESQDRDAAAKLTSESTARQAQLAQTDSYISHHRRANYPRPAGLKQFASSPSSPSSPKNHQRPDTTKNTKRPMTFAETKAEQARLLTLLRTLPPPTVVDQICKALAFFGGIPDAPPPADGKFPESAEANGSGSLFVGWFAEIFPDLDNPRKPPPPESPASQKRPRGRPKGSKASKIRSDKGLKKMTQKGLANTTSVPEPADDSWVDIEDSVLEINGDGDLVEVDATQRNVLSTPSQPRDHETVDTTPAAGSTADLKSVNNGSAIASAGSGAKRRGRPKGSKNRPKDPPTSQSAGEPSKTSTTVTSTNTAKQPGAPTTSVPSKITPVPVPVFAPSSQPKKTNAGRPKGSKNRPKPSADSNATVGQTSPESQKQPSTSSGSKGGNSYGQARMAVPAAQSGVPSSAPNGIVPPSDGIARPPTQPSSTPGFNTPGSLVKESTIVSLKRKRHPAKLGDAGPKRAERDTNTTGLSHPAPEQEQAPRNVSSQSPATSQMRTQGTAQQPVDTSTPVTKRARKSKEANTTQGAKRQIPTNSPMTDTVSTLAERTPQITQLNNPSQNRPSPEGIETRYDPTATVLGRNEQAQIYATERTQRPSQQQQQQQQQQPSLPVAAPASQSPAEGLAAHYERFAALQTHRHDNSRQPVTNRPQKLRQTASPTPSQVSQSSQLPATLASQSRATTQSYYSQPQTLGAPYSSTQAGFTPTQRHHQQPQSQKPSQQQQQQQQSQQLQMNSPQFGTQSNSPLIHSDNSYRASPTAAHNSSAFVPRRTPSASPLDANNYRPNSATNQGLPSQASPFTSRQSATTTPSSSLPGLQSPFQPFSTDPAFLDIQGLDSGANHGGIGLGAGAYGISSSAAAHQHQPRTSNSAAASGYSQASGLNNYLGSSSIGRPSQNRWP